MHNSFKICIECLLCAMHCASHWGYNHKKACDICSYKVHNLKDLCLRHSRYSIKLSIPVHLDYFI